MKISLVFALALLLAAPAVSAGDKSSPASSLVGKKAPAFAFPIDGFRLVSLRRLLEKKKPIVLSFFAWHCKPCEKGLPMLVRTVEKLGKRQVEVLLVHVGEDKDGAMDQLLERAGATAFDHVIDGGRMQAAKFGADRTIPRTVVIDAKGVVKKVFLEEGDDFEAELEAALKDASI